MKKNKQTRKWWKNTHKKKGIHISIPRQKKRRKKPIETKQEMADCVKPVGIQYSIRRWFAMPRNIACISSCQQVVLRLDSHLETISVTGKTLHIYVCNERCVLSLC